MHGHFDCSYHSLALPASREGEWNLKLFQTHLIFCLFGAELNSQDLVCPQEMRYHSPLR